MAAGWADQPAAVPTTPTRVLLTPAARAYLHATSVRIDDRPVPPVIRLADARTLVDASPPAASQSCALAASPLSWVSADGVESPMSGGWASVDVRIPVDVPARRQLAHALVAAGSALGRIAGQEVSALARTLSEDGATQDVLVTDLGSLSVAGAERNLIDPTAAAARPDTVLEIVDGSAAGVARLAPSPAGRRVVVGIGANTRQVVAHRAEDGQELIAVADVVEVWVHGGGLLTEAHTAAVAVAVGHALSTGVMA